MILIRASLSRLYHSPLLRLYGEREKTIVKSHHFLENPRCRCYDNCMTFSPSGFAADAEKVFLTGGDFS
jgi:hypothetical protein